MNAWDDVPRFDEDFASSIDTAALDEEIVAADVGDNLRQISAEGPKRRLLDDVELMNVPDPEYLIDGILMKRGICPIYGPPESYKTTLLAGMHVAIATGRDWFGHAVKQRGESCYVGAEDVSGWKVRLNSAKRAAGFPLDQCIGVHTFPDAIDLRDSASVRGFIAFLRAQDPGDVLVVFSDGITEAMSPDGSEFGEERLLATIRAGRELPSTRLLQELLDSVREFIGGADQSDDLTALVLRYTGS
jgi:hypothetical protein